RVVQSQNIPLDPNIRTAQLRAEDKKREDFLAGRNAEAMRSDLERDIDTRTKAILKAAEDVGVTLTEAAAKIQAQGELAIEQAAEASKKGLRDLIGHYEGTDKGRGYNETLGYGAFTGGDVNLVAMTLREVLDLQKRMLAHPGNGYNSSAVGRYQIVSITLKELIGKLNLDLDERFSPELQDRLADELIRRRGRNASGLRNEWEGLRRASDDQILGAFDNQSLSMPVVDPQVGASRQAFEDRLKERRQYLASLQAEMELRASLNPLVNDYGQAMNTLQAAQYLLNAATEEGTAAGKELKDVQQLLHGDLSKLSPEARKQAEAMRELANVTGRLEAADNALSDSQGRLQEKMAESSALGKDVLGGFIRDLRDGKS
ncbi:hypothetical protein C9W97_26050, partial [Salmonella enterica subsp. enterica serovar Enteritidis]|nr:hypothetical protein [Salmonella enterica subsp. enterica serovar Enteritidis]